MPCASRYATVGWAWMPRRSAGSSRRSSRRRPSAAGAWVSGSRTASFRGMAGRCACAAEKAKARHSRSPYRSVGRRTMAETCVLVVDDEASVATTIEAILKMDGHDVLAVTSGTEAIRLLNERQFDVVLTDLRLADVDGIDILKEVQRTAPDTAAIMLTGYASLESAVAALRSGAYDYL